MPECRTGVGGIDLCGVPGGSLVLHNKLRNKMLTARLIRRIRLIMANRVEFYCFAYLNISLGGFWPWLSATANQLRSRAFCDPSYQRMFFFLFHFALMMRNSFDEEQKFLVRGCEMAFSNSVWSKSLAI